MNFKGGLILLRKFSSRGGNIFSELWMLLLNKQVVDKLQSGGKSGRESWRTELPSTGLGVGVIEKMKDEKSKDVAWQGKCSGAVYVCYFCCEN